METMTMEHAATGEIPVAAEPLQQPVDTQAESQDRTIRIVRNEFGQITIAPAELPQLVPKLDILVSLPTDAMRRTARLYRTYPLPGIIEHTLRDISLQDWADAAALALSKRSTHSMPGERLAPSDIGYLSIGDYVYKVSPVAIAKPTRALTVIRKKIRDEAQREKDQIVQRAQAASASVLSEAQTNASDITREAMRLRDQAAQALRQIPNPAPQWAAEQAIPLRLIRGTWYVRREIQFAITEMETTTLVYRIPHPIATSALLWIPTGPGLSLTQIRSDRGQDVLPHISTERSCFSLSTTFSGVTGIVSLRHVSSLIAEAMRKVQLDSLLTNYQAWKHHVPDDIPDQNDLAANPYTTWISHHGESKEDEEESTWTT